jgi:hypothetical protein
MQRIPERGATKTGSLALGDKERAGGGGIVGPMRTVSLRITCVEAELLRINTKNALRGIGWWLFVNIQ